MVMADRNNIEARSGRRSRGPSPNGHISDDSSATEDSDHDNGMRVGDDFQARIPLYTPDSKPDPKAEAMLVWAPHPELPESKINEYIALAKEKHGYNTEQALGMLFWHKHNVDKALTDLPNFTPFPDEWTVEDKVLFEQAFSFHGKSFHRIRQMLPDKSIASLVKYYYSWKKTRSRTSLMDRQARKLAGPRDDSEGEGSGESDSDSEMTKENGQKEGKAGIQQNANSILRPSMAKRSDPRHNPMKNKRRPPRGMHLKTEDLIPLATGPPGQGEAILKQLEAELVSLKREVQNNKQEISIHKQKAVASIDHCRPTEAPLKLTAKWSNEELLLAVQGIRKYGKDFGAIAEVIGNKTEAHIRSFFSNYRRRYNLDEVLQEYEAEHGNDGSTGEDVEKMEVDTKPESESVNGHSSESNGNPTPPPLVKQSGCAPSPIEVQVPSQQPTRMTLAPSSNTSLLQQPPPLVKPQLLNSQPNKSHKPTLLPSKN